MREEQKRVRLVFSIVWPILLNVYWMRLRRFRYPGDRLPAAAIIGNLTFAVSSIEDFKAADESYDMVLGLSILHLVQNKEAIIAWVRTLLKPVGPFVTNTVCIGDANIFIRLMVPLGRMLGLVPLVKVFTTKNLVKAIAGSGFEIEHQWSPGKNKAVFIVARKTT